VARTVSPPGLSLWRVLQSAAERGLRFEHAFDRPHDVVGERLGLLEVVRSLQKDRALPDTWVDSDRYHDGPFWEDGGPDRPSPTGKPSFFRILVVRPAFNVVSWKRERPRMNEDAGKILARTRTDALKNYDDA
jgi:hypothetical protein